MRTFAITTEPYGTFVAADGVVYAEKDNADRHGERLRALVDQANAARELWDALESLLCNMRIPIIGEPPPPISHVHAWDRARITIAKHRGIK